jgi:hypothetical protein
VWHRCSSIECGVVCTLLCAMVHTCLWVQVLLEMYQKYQEEWIVELLYDDLLDWNNWFVKARSLPPLNITCLGGENMQGARYESGLDNRCAFACAFLLHHQHQHRPALAPATAPAPSACSVRYERSALRPLCYTERAL